MRVFRVVVLMLAIGFGFCSSAPGDAQTLQNADVMDLPLSSVLVREKDVFACNADGLFRASRSDKVWTQLALPPGMRPGGMFAFQPEKSKVVLYHTGPSDRTRGETLYNAFGQLYLSQDDGQTWREILRRPMITTVLLQPNGNLIVDDTPPFVVGLGPMPPHPVAHIVESSDLGATWLDISPAPKLPWVASWSETEQPSSIVIHGRVDAGEPATHPGVPVGVLGPSRFYRLDNHSKQWYDVTAEHLEKNHHQQVNGDWMLPWEEGAVRHVRLLSSSATLATYFSGKYKANLFSKPMYEIIPKKSAYHFTTTQRKFIDVEMVINPEAPGEHEGTGQNTVFFPIDDRRSTRFWGLSITVPDGQYSYVKPVYDKGWAASPEQPQSKQEIFRDLLNRGRLRLERLHPAEPYVRRLDLDRLGRFDQPGTYKVSITYESSWLKGLGYVDQIEPWLGNLAGQEFEVTITPQK